MFALLSVYLVRAQLLACIANAMQVAVNKKTLSEWGFSFTPPLSVDKSVYICVPCIHITHMASMSYIRWMAPLIVYFDGDHIENTRSNRDFRRIFFFVFFFHINNKHIYMSFRSLSSTHFFNTLARFHYSIHNMFWLWLGTYFHYYWNSLIDAHAVHFVHSSAYSKFIRITRIWIVRYSRIYLQKTYRKGSIRDFDRCSNICFEWYSLT